MTEKRATLHLWTLSFHLSSDQHLRSVLFCWAEVANPVLLLVVSTVFAHGEISQKTLPYSHSPAVTLNPKYRCKVKRAWGVVTVTSTVTRLGEHL